MSWVVYSCKWFASDVQLAVRRCSLKWNVCTLHTCVTDTTRACYCCCSMLSFALRVECPPAHTCKCWLYSRAYSPKHPNGAQARSSSASPAQEAPLEQPNVGRQQQQQRQHDADDANGVVSLHKTMLDKRGAKRSRSPLEEHDYVDDDTHHQHQQQLKRLEPLNGAGEQGEQKGFQTAASDRCVPPAQSLQ